jgi:hypothetical protein
MAKKQRVNLLEAASLGIPEKVNTYLELKYIALADPDAQLVVRALEATMNHFKVPQEKQAFLGNLMQRISMVLARDDDNIEYYIASEDAALHNLIDMVEHFQRVAERFAN